MKALGFVKACSALPSWTSKGSLVDSMDIVDYSGFKVLTANWTDSSISSDIVKILESNLVEIWSDTDDIYEDKSVKMMVPGDFASEFTVRLREKGVFVNEKIADVGALIEAQKEDKKSKMAENPTTFAYDVYYDYDELEEWQYKVARKHDFNSKVHELGSTFEGRSILGFEMSDLDISSEKPKIIVDCGVHAREWIGPAACRQFIHEMLHNVGYPDREIDILSDESNAMAGDPYTKAEMVKLFDDFNWFVILSLNPDGYQYSHDVDRMWRKNRADNNHVCRGVDINLNFPIGFGEKGDSQTTNPCNFEYPSTQSFDQPEAKAYADWLELLNEQGGKIAAQISVHSFGQKVKYPYPSDDSDKKTEMKTVTDELTKTIFDAFGTSYTSTEFNDIINESGGRLTDFTFHKDGLNIPYSWIYELRDTGDYGFLLPPKYIKEVGQEMTKSFISLGNYLRN